MYRLILETGEGLPTRVFGGNYETLQNAERARDNVEKTTHYKGHISQLEEPPSMLLNATQVVPESESYPDEQPSLFPAGFPMPVKPKPVNNAPPPSPPVAPPAPPAPPQEDQPGGDDSSGIFADPPHKPRDAEAMEGISPEQIRLAYHRLGAITVHGQAAGNGNWQPCAGGDYNRITGHWRESDEQGHYRLLSIFEIASRENRFETVHEARLNLFRGLRPEPEPQSPDPIKEPGKAETAKPLPLFVQEVRQSMDRLQEANRRMQSAASFFDFSFALCELNSAIEEMQTTVDFGIIEVIYPAKDCQALPNPSGGIESTTIEEMGIAKGTCNLLAKAGVSTYGDIITLVTVDGGENDWDQLTTLGGIGKAKVDSIRGACEKLVETRGNQAE